ncbi:hypothetical protein Y013_18085 [Rhodococcus pyridinivorans SB3094]|uniref:YhcG N-terminal domain-containing protein n=1 Tax=Rhodococcus pyridinivorans SB3094 TaxID=1435356 RepID=V9XK81_9NOCA|nr:hypothetical protein Y013_18085 [Rhodococcus pyridinivorans SB3094]APE11618.1 hypothetical protein BO226_22495 [Rhodococcus sp. 2G]OBA35676.1 hypothetical protein A5767_10840 [Rhodococcus sp. 852002-51564_SCH6189132-a]
MAVTEKTIGFPRTIRNSWTNSKHRFVDQLARDLRSEFPHMRGLSRRNLFYMRSFADAWPRK